MPRPSPRAAGWIPLVLALVLGCNPPGKAPATTATEVHAGVHVLEVFNHGAGRTSPLVVALHGRGGSPEKFSRFWRDLDDEIEVALPQGFSSHGWGYAWFDWPQGLSDEQLSTAVAAAADRLWPAIAEIAGGRKVIVVGFSQGAVLAFALAARHPEAVAQAFPLAGASPRQIFVPGRTPAPVYALHGTADRVLPVFLGRSAVAAFKEHGGAAELRELPGVDHTLTPEMRDDVLAHLRPLLRAAPAGDAGTP